MAIKLFSEWPFLGASLPFRGWAGDHRSRKATVTIWTPGRRYDRAAIMRKAWRDFRRVRAAGDCGLTFGDWLRGGVPLALHPQEPCEHKRQKEAGSADANVEDDPIDGGKAGHFPSFSASAARKRVIFSSSPCFLPSTNPSIASESAASLRSGSPT